MEQQISNNELAKKFDENVKLQAEKLVEHQKDDTEHFKIIEEKMDTLATKEDIKAMGEAFNDFVYAVNLFKSTSKWGYRALLVASSIVLAIAGIAGGIKILIGK